METNFKDNPKLRLQIYKQILELLKGEKGVDESISYHLIVLFAGIHSPYKYSAKEIHELMKTKEINFPEIYWKSDVNWIDIPLNETGNIVRIELMKSSIRILESKINQVGGGEEMFKKATLSIEVKVTPKTFWQRLFSKMRFWK